MKHAYKTYFEKLRSSAPVDMLRRESEGKPLNYIEQLEKKMSRASLHNSLLNVAYKIEPVGPLGIDTNMPHTMAFYRGGLLCVRAVQKILPSEVRISMVEASQPYEQPCETQATVDDIHEAALAILDVAYNGYGDAQNYYSLVNDWVGALVPSVDCQPMFRAGLGYIMHLATEVERQCEEVAWQEFHLSLICSKAESQSKSN